LTRTLDDEQSKLCRQQEDNKSKLDAREREYRSKLDELKHGNENGVLNDQLAIWKEATKKAKSDWKAESKEVTRLKKLNASATKKHETISNELDDYVWDVRTLKEDNKVLTRDLAAAKKKLADQLEMKLKHDQRKAEIGLEKKKMQLETIHKARKKKHENEHHQHQYKKELVKETKRAAIDVITAQEEVKSKKQKSRVKQAAERINTAQLMHTTANGRFPPSNAMDTNGSIAQVCFVGMWRDCFAVILIFYFISFISIF
jgi:hypothetical protein